jgi:hypothetical protein
MLRCAWVPWDSLYRCFAQQRPRGLAACLAFQVAGGQAVAGGMASSSTPTAAKDARPHALLDQMRALAGLEAVGVVHNMRHRALLTEHRHLRYSAATCPPICQLLRCANASTTTGGGGGEGRRGGEDGGRWSSLVWSTWRKTAGGGDHAQHPIAA